VLPAIHFNNKPRFQANKVKDEVAERVLAPEFTAFSLTSSQPSPERLLSICHVAPKHSL